MFDYFRSHVGTRVTALVSIISLAVFAGLIAVSAYWQKTGMVAQMDASLTRTSELIRLSVEKPMVVGDDAGTKGEFRFLKDKYPDTELYITNFKGNVTYSTRSEAVRRDFDEAYPQQEVRELAGTALGERIEAGLLFSGDGRDLFMRVMSVENEKSCHHCHGGSQPILGEIVVVQDVSPAMAAIDRQLYEFVGLCALGLVLLVTPVVLFLRKSVIARIAAIAASSSDVARGDFDAAFDASSPDELGLLAGNLSDMVAKLKTQLGFSQGILSGMTMACYVVDTDGCATFVNEPLLGLLGLEGSPDSFAGVSIGELFYGDPQRETVAQKVLRDRKAHAQPQLEHADRSGVIRYLSIEAAPLYDLDGNLIGAFALIADLTDMVEQRRLIEVQNERIAKAAGDAEQVSINVSSAADELSSQVEEASRGSDQQLARTGEVATAMEQMNVTVLEVARNSGEVSDLADQTREKAEEGRLLADETASIADAVAVQVESLRESMAQLGGQAESVGRIVDVISDIADQTNLLALNAAIEAARAGDAGRGFAVVADEVRKLAERTMAATQEVTQSIGGIQKSAKANIVSTEEAASHVGESREKARVSGRALLEIVKMVERTADQVRSIATAAEEQSATSEEIASSSDDINRIAGETAQAMTESARAVSDLAEQAQVLREIIEDMRNA